MAKFSNEGIMVGDIEIDITTKGPDSEAEAVHLHTHDQAVRAAQAVLEEQPPEECDGIGMGINWAKKFDWLEGDDGD